MVSAEMYMKSLRFGVKLKLSLMAIEEEGSLILMQLTGMAVGLVVGKLVGDTVGDFVTCQHNTCHE